MYFAEWIEQQSLSHKVLNSTYTHYVHTHIIFWWMGIVNSGKSNSNNDNDDDGSCDYNNEKFTVTFFSKNHFHLLLLL